MALPEYTNGGMNGGFKDIGLDEDAFGPKGGLDSLRSFDAFPKTKPSYTVSTSTGGQWTIALIILCLCLTYTELSTWWQGEETHHFSVERGVGHELQLNLDIVVHMQCKDLHVNVQDAAMDRIVAGDLLKKDDTTWGVWTGDRRKGDYRGERGYDTLHEDNRRRRRAEEEDSHVAHVLGHMREGGKKFAKTPRTPWGAPHDSCRIYGSLEGNKVQGDFHITARGHGYAEFGRPQHLDHSLFNFSHHINELSFGPHYPGLLNPLDRTSDSTETNFYKFQYYVSIVPTIFTKRRISTKSGALDPNAIFQPPTLDMTPNMDKKDEFGRVLEHKAQPQANVDSKSIFTNQYAATSQSHEVPHSNVPGIFFKYDIEPILLIVSGQRTSLLALLVRLVNVLSGVVVGGSWMFNLSEWAKEIVGRRRRNNSFGSGVIHGRHDEKLG